MMISSKDIVEIHNTDTDKRFTISWKMTDWCNFDCPYCITGKHKQPATSVKTLLNRAKNINNIINQVSNDKKIRLHLIGGEVTYYNLIEILQQIDLTRVDALNLITNFSQSIHWFYNFLDFLYDHRIAPTLVASYHEEYGAKTLFIDKLKKIKERYPHLNLLMSVVIDENLDEEFLESAQKIGVKLNLSVLRDASDNKNVELDQTLTKKLDQYDDKSKGITNYIYTDRKRFTFGTSAAANDQIIEGGLIADGYYCTAGSTTCRILPDGRVVGAGCNYCQKSIILGNIDNNDVKLLTKPIQCHLDSNRRCNFCYKLNIFKELE